MPSTHKTTAKKHDSELKTTTFSVTLGEFQLSKCYCRRLFAVMQIRVYFLTNPHLFMYRLHNQRVLSSHVASFVIAIYRCQYISAVHHYFCLSVDCKHFRKSFSSSKCHRIQFLFTNSCLPKCTWNSIVWEICLLHFLKRPYIHLWILFRWERMKWDFWIKKSQLEWCFSCSCFSVQCLPYLPTTG